MAKPYSMDLRERVLRARQEGSTQREIAERFDLSESTVYAWLRRFREEGTVEPLPHGGGQPPAVDEQGSMVLREIVETQNDLTLAEYNARYRERMGITLSQSALWRAIDKLQITRKKSH